MMKRFMAVLLTAVMIIICANPEPISAAAELSALDELYLEATFSGIDTIDADELYGVEIETVDEEECGEEVRERTLLTVGVSSDCETELLGTVNRTDFKQLGNRYVYNQLTDAEKEFWDLLDDKCNYYMTTAVKIVAGTTGKCMTQMQRSDKLTQDQCTKVAWLFKYMNPQYFFLGNTIYKPASGYAGASIMVYPGLASYNEGRHAAIDEVFDRVDEWTGMLEQCSDEYEKALKLHNLVCERVDYLYDDFDEDTTYTQSAYSVLRDGQNLKTICAGYAMSYSLVANAAGLDAILAFSTSHAWNKIIVNGIWYNVDCTWDDNGGIVRNTYFLRGDECSAMNNSSHVLRDYYRPYAPKCEGDYGTVFTYMITYYLDGGTNAAGNPTMFKNTDKEVIELLDPVRGDDVFAGWYTDSGFFNRVTEINPASAVDYELYAKWLPSRPTGVEAKCDLNGVRITWDESKNATGYSLYKREGSGELIKFATVKGDVLAYTDTDVKTGTAYGYSVKAYNSAGYSAFSGEYTCLYVAAPFTIKTDNADGGLKISWSEVQGASGYYVYRSTDGSNYKKCKTTSKTHYTDKTVSKGINASYKVRAYFSYAGEIHKSVTIAVQGCRMDAPVVTSISDKKNGVKIEYHQVEGATDYYIYRKASGDSTYRLIRTQPAKTSGTVSSYTDENAVVSGTTYRYRVVAACVYDEEHKCISDTSNSLSIVYLGVPDVKVSLGASEMKLSWKGIDKANGYNVYRSTDGSKFQLVKTVTDLNYTDKSADNPGQTYWYRVSAIRKVSDRVTAGDVGKAKAMFISAPRIKSIRSTASGKMKISWTKVKGATGYRIIYSTSKGMKKCKSVVVKGKSTTVKTIKNLKGSKKYYVKVLAIREKNGQKIYSARSTKKVIKIKK